MRKPTATGERGGEGVRGGGPRTSPWTRPAVGSVEPQMVDQTRGEAVGIAARRVREADHGEDERHHRKEGVERRRRAGVATRLEIAAKPQDRQPANTRITAATGPSLHRPDPTARRRCPSPTHASTIEPCKANNHPCYATPRMRAVRRRATRHRDAEQRQRCRPSANLLSDRRFQRHQRLRPRTCSR